MLAQVSPSVTVITAVSAGSVSLMVMVEAGSVRTDLEKSSQHTASFDLKKIYLPTKIHSRRWYRLCDVDR